MRDGGPYRVLSLLDRRHLPKLTAIDLFRDITFTLLVPLGSDVINRLSPVRLLLTLRASASTRRPILVVPNEPRITRACSISVLSNAVTRNMTVTIIRTSGVSCAWAYLTICLTTPFLVRICRLETIPSLGCEGVRGSDRGSDRAEVSD